MALLEPVKPYDHAPSGEFWPAYLRGLVCLQMKDGAGAAVEFRSILDHRGEVPVGMLYPLAYLGLARAAALTSDLTGAQTAYEKFFAAWKDADADLIPVKDARVELARLRNGRANQETSRVANR
jgi:hypothetical protein